jgi:hypothetical protein
VSEDEVQPLRDGLDPWERWLVGLLGLALEVVGGISIFVTPNQAATATVFLVGTVLLLIGIQGTPLLRASTRDIELQARKAAEKAEERLDSGSTDDAYEVLEDAVTLTPGLTREPVFRALIATAFEKVVLSRLTHVVADLPVADVHLGVSVVGPLGPTLDRYPDAVIRFRAHRDVRIAVEAKYLSRPGQLTAWATATAQEHFDRYAGVLFIVNSDAVVREAAYNTDERVQVVAWHGREDDVRLRAAIDMLRQVAAAQDRP